MKIEMSWSDITYNRLAPTMIPIRLLDVNKIKTKLNWEAKTNISDGLRKTIDWYKNVK
jgi:nucleoside-diphosphate-sugar epimerase